MFCTMNVSIPQYACTPSGVEIHFFGLRFLCACEGEEVHVYTHTLVMSTSKTVHVLSLSLLLMLLLMVNDMRDHFFALLVLLFAM